MRLRYEHEEVTREGTVHYAVFQCTQCGAAANFSISKLPGEDDEDDEG